MNVAIVAPSPEIGAAVADALRASGAFESVRVVASESDARGADLILIAQQPPTELGATRPTSDETLSPVPLSNRERQILVLLADGLGNKQIAARLGISTNTVKTHLELLFEKLDVSSRAEAVAVGVRRGLLFL